MNGMGDKEIILLNWLIRAGNPDLEHSTQN
jgi:hypothetical protein